MDTTTQNGLVLHSGDDEAIHPSVRLARLEQMELTDGWPAFCRAFQRELESTLDAQIFDVKTPSDVRDSLVHARKVIIESLSPQKVLGKYKGQLLHEHKRREKPI